MKPPRRCSPAERCHGELTAEAEELQKELKRLISQGPSAGQLEGLAAIVYQNREMSLGIAVNSGIGADPDLQSMIALDVTADPARIDALLGTIDFGAIGELVR